MNKFVPLKSAAKLSLPQTLARFKACIKNIQTFEQKPALFSRLVISDEQLLPVSNLRGNRKSTYQDRRFTVIPFFDKDGLIHAHVTEPGVNVTAAYYSHVLKDFRAHYDNLRPPCEGPVQPLPLLIDNATFHVTPLVKKALGDLDLVRVAHPSHSSDLNPCDYYLFRSLNLRLRNSRKWPLDSSRESRKLVISELKGLLHGDIMMVLMAELRRRWIVVCVEHLIKESRG